VRDISYSSNDSVHTKIHLLYCPDLCPKYGENGALFTHKVLIDHQLSYVCKDSHWRFTVPYGITIISKTFTRRKYVLPIAVFGDTLLLDFFTAIGCLFNGMRSSWMFASKCLYDSLKDFIHEY